MPWVSLAIIVAIFYGGYNVFTKAASGHINQIAGALILQIAAAVVGGLILLGMKIKGVPLQISSKGVWLAILAGVSVGLAEISLFYFFSRGISVSLGTPVIVGSSVAIAAILGVIFLRESLLPIEYLGIALIIGGTVILSLR